MPELPEVETVCRALRTPLVGRRITDVRALTAKMRTPLSTPALRAFCEGRKILDIRRRAKYIIVELDSKKVETRNLKLGNLKIGNRKSAITNPVLLLHLGMTGAFRVCPAADPVEKHARIIWTLDDGRQWRFLDARKFGGADCCELRTPGGIPAEIDHLGIEPLEAAFTTEFLWQKSRGRNTPVKCLLMDQATVVGIGNIYASEACFRAGVRPQRPAGKLTRAECAKLVKESRAVLRAAIACGGTTIRDFNSVDGTEGHFDTKLNVYGRTGQPCPRCAAGHRIQKLTLGGRSSFYCAKCQK